MSTIIKLVLIAITVVVIYVGIIVGSFKPDLDPWSGTANPDVDISQCEQTHNCYFGN